MFFLCSDDSAWSSMVAPTLEPAWEALCSAVRDLLTVEVSSLSSELVHAAPLTALPRGHVVSL